MKDEKKAKKQPKLATSFATTRSRRELETAEDYVELIADLVQSKKEARTCDIAAHLGVSHVTVIRTIRRLQQKGYLLSQPNRAIVLSQLGKDLAIFAKNRHDLVLRYLLFIGVPEEIAIIDAEGIEHHMSEQTLNAIRLQLSKS